MTLTTLYITDEYGLASYMKRSFNGQERAFQKTFYDKMGQYPERVIFEIKGKCFLRKYNKLTDDDFEFIIEQLYCEWRFKL